MLRNNNYFSLFSSYLSLLVFIIPNFCDFNKSSGAKSIVIGYKLLWLEDLFIFLHLLSGPQGSQQSCPDGIFLFVFCFNFYYFNLFQDIQGRCVSSSENIQWDNRKYGPVVKRFFFFPNGLWWTRSCDYPDSIHHVLIGSLANPLLNSLLSSLKKKKKNTIK